jgi:septal ring factor EnvC (AmiA/AmiB activator)
MSVDNSTVEAHPYAWKMLHRWSAIMGAVVITVAAVSAISGWLPYVTVEELEARIVPIEEEITGTNDNIKELKRQLDQLLAADKQERIDRIGQEHRDVNRQILDVRSRIDSGEGSQDTRALLMQLEKDESALSRQLELLQRHR